MLTSAGAAAPTFDTASPSELHLRPDAGPQSLGAGRLGLALLHFERVRTGREDPEAARESLRACAHPKVNCAPDTNLYNGGPALSFVLHATEAHERYGILRARLHERARAIVAERLALANERIRRRRPTGFAEYSALSGLTGLTAYLLTTEPGHDLTQAALMYLVELTKPLPIDGVLLPGWWASHDPHMKTSPEFPGGHANLGMAHGIAGPLACMAIALRIGIEVPGHREAIESTSRFFDHWQSAQGWWPQWLTRSDLRQGRSAQTGPGRPSWCYGAPGIARALQLAGIALGDASQQLRAESSLLRCLADQGQQAKLSDTGLCHGIAGLYRITARAAADAGDERLAKSLPALRRRLLSAAPADASFLDGAAGLSLVQDEAGGSLPTGTVWDVALLLTAPKERK